MKPGDVYLGVVDLFSILLPGAIAVAYCDRAGGRDIVSQFLPSEAFIGAGGWIQFSLASFAAGHIVFLIAAQFDRTYNFFREKLWPDSEGNAFFRANEIRKSVLKTSSPGLPMNTFSWAKAELQIHSAQAAIDVARFEADEKFFRSLSLVFCVIGAASLTKEKWIVGFTILLLGFISFARYVERRYKATQWAYYYVLVIFGKSSLPEGM